VNTIDSVVREVRNTAHYVSDNMVNYVHASEGTNPSGEAQKGADVWADSLFFDALSPLPGVGAYASEERAEVDDCGEGYSVDHIELSLTSSRA